MWLIFSLVGYAGIVTHDGIMIDNISMVRIVMIYVFFFSYSFVV